MRKKLIIAGLFCVLFLCGCKSKTELGKDDIMVVFYADYNENSYEISAEILDFQNDEGSFIKTAYGSSFEIAYENLVKSLKKPPYTGHAGALIIGDGLCENSLYETINFFSGVSLISPNIAVMLTEDDIRDFKPNSIYDKIKNETLEKLPLYTLFLPENKISSIPVISAVENEPQNTGNAVFEDFIFKYYVSDKKED